jgi:hypothetical protein
MSSNVRKVTLAIGKEEYAWAERRAKRVGTSVSAVLSAAARQQRQTEERDERQRRAWAEVLAFVTGGDPLTPEELAGARRDLDREDAPRRRAPARGRR